MSVLTRTDVTAVKLYESFILAGIGSWMNVFDRNSAKLIQKIHVLNGQKIYNFVPSKGTKVLVFGGKQFTIITTSSEVFVQLFEAIVCNDWLHSGVWLSDSRVALLTAHNVVQIWDTTNQSLVTEYISKENSILYSGLLLPLADDILVFSGTVYSEVLIRRCGSNAVLHSLQGHKGVIFSVSCCLSKGIIVTTSDDRSVRIWQLDNTSAFLPNSVDYWENVNITCIHELYGHLARVMRNCIKDDFVVSIGEDSCICFWGYDGILQRKLITHQNACIWSLDADDKDLLTGGGDSGVILHPLTILMEYGTKKVLDIEATNAKKVAFTARRNIVIMTDSNELVYYVTHDKSPSIFRLQHESTYKLLSISSCKQIVAVVDMAGKLDVFIETCKGPPGIQHLIDTKLDVGKIFYMGWAGNRHLVLCSDTGAITVLASKDNGTEKFANFILPPCKERWLTSVAINVKKDLLVVGDRCGSLHIYITGQKNPTQSFKGVHGRYGATSISIHNNSIITTGKDGTVKYFYVDNDCKVKLMSKQIIDFQWVETFIDKDRHYICGFQERIFVVYDIRNNNRVFEVPCGGGHRSWDVTRYIDKVGDKYKECIEFVYLKNSNIQLETFEIGKVSSRNIVSGTHSKEINCLKTHVCELDPSLTFIISGGEDTSLRISRLISDIDFRDEVIFRHLSNIRTLKYATMDDNNVLLVSAGGRAQICIKLLQFEKDGDEVKVVTEELSDYLISGTDKDRKGNQSWRNCSVDFDPETRVMDLDIIKVDGKFIIIAGCSDAYLRVFDFKYSGYKAEFKLMQQIKHHNTCILKTHSLKYQDRTLVITCTTRGILTFWHLANMNDSESLQLNPFETLSIHKSGINSLGCKVLDREILVATGGDDNTVHLNLIGIKENLETSVNSTWSSSTLHCSEITGISVVDDLIVTTSIDQRVTMLRWWIDEGIQCEFVTQVFSDVADIQGLEVLKQDSDTITVCVFGKGLEVISMPRRSL